MAAQDIDGDIVRLEQGTAAQGVYVIEGGRRAGFRRRQREPVGAVRLGARAGGGCIVPIGSRAGDWEPGG